MKHKQGFSHETIPLFHHPPPCPVPRNPSIRSGYATLSENFTTWDSSGRPIMAIEGMPTDGISIPSRLTGIARILPFRSPYLRPAISHDHICYQSLSLAPGPERRKLRLSGDKLFYEMCLFVKPELQCKAWVMYRCVRIGAWTSQNEPIWPSYVHQYDLFMKRFLRPRQQSGERQ